MNTNYQDQIDLYLSGKMSKDGQRVFETELHSNCELNNQYLFTLAIQNEFQDRKQKKNKIIGWRREATDIRSCPSDINDDSRLVFENLKRRHIRYRRIGLVAATVVFVFFLAILPKSQSSRDSQHPKITNMESSRHNSTDITNVPLKDDISQIQRTSHGAKLSTQQQEIYWERAKILHKQGKREDCVEYLKILIKQEGVYSQNADSLLHDIYKNH